jgi:hypothetical protein
MTVTTTHLSPITAGAHLVTISFAHCKTVLSRAINTAHIINCVIVNKLIPTPPLCSHPPSFHRGYAFAAESILLKAISPPSHYTIHFIGTIIVDNTGDVLEYGHLMKMDKHKHIWAHGFTNEIGQLFQGIRNVPGTDTYFFIPKSHVPAHKRPTYGHICFNYQPQKELKHCIRLTIGEDCIDYPGNKSTPMTDLTTAKILINSTISTPGAKFFGINLVNLYLNNPMRNPKYMHLRLDIIPDKIIVHYNLCNIVTPDGWVCIKIQKGMYGLPQAGILANQLLEKCLATKRYYQCQHTFFLWHHVWWNITFYLVVDDFGMKVTVMHDMDHLVDVLKK